MAFPTCTLPLSTVALNKIVPDYINLVSEFTDEIGRIPTLQEFLEIICSTIPWKNDALDRSFVEPLGFRISLTDNGNSDGYIYRSLQPSQVTDLNDNVPSLAVEQNSILVDQIKGASGECLVSPQQFLSAILQILQTGKVPLADVHGEDVHNISVDLSLGIRMRADTLQRGDILAIPLLQGGFRLGVMLTRNRFGTALGLFRGRVPRAELDASVTYVPGKFAIHTGEELIGKEGENGDTTWRIIAHEKELLKLFPTHPEIFHLPRAYQPMGTDTG